MNATFAAAMARAGNVGFISQSGALLTAILDWSQIENVGFSAIVSLGSMLDVGWGDWIDYLGDDAQKASLSTWNPLAMHGLSCPQLARWPFASRL